MDKNRMLHTNNAWIEIAKSYPQYNFIAVAYTPWHAISIDALLIYLKERGVQLTPAIVITEHPQTGWALSESDFTNDTATFFYHPRNVESNIKTTYCQLLDLNFRCIFNRIMFVFCDLFHRRNSLYYVTNCFPIPEILHEFSRTLHRTPIVAYSEEGVASYMGTLKAPFSDINKVKDITSLRLYIEQHLICNKLYKNLHRHVSVKILKKTLFGIKPNKRVIPYYLSVIEKKCHNSKVGNYDIQNSIIICTTAWNRDMVDDNEDLNVLIRVCDYLYNKGYNLLLKTHPRDSFFEKYSHKLHCSRLVVDNLPIECICHLQSPKAIISFSSTSLITPRLFWNIPCFCLSNLLNRKNIGYMYLQEIDSFQKTFRNLVCFVSDIEDIKI